MIAGLLKDIAEAEAKIGEATSRLTKWVEEMEQVALIFERPDQAIGMVDELQVRKYELLAAHSRLLQLRTQEKLERARAHEGAALRAAHDESSKEDNNDG